MGIGGLWLIGLGEAGLAWAWPAGSLSALDAQRCRRLVASASACGCEGKCAHRAILGSAALGVNGPAEVVTEAVTAAPLAAP